MQSRPTERRREMVEDHCMPAPFGLGSLPGIVDDERIQMGNGPQRQTGRAGSTEADRFARQPLRAAVLADMNHQLTTLNLPQPEVLG